MGYTTIDETFVSKMFLWSLLAIDWHEELRFGGCSSFCVLVLSQRLLSLQCLMSYHIATPNDVCHFQSAIKEDSSIHGNYLPTENENVMIHWISDLDIW